MTRGIRSLRAALLALILFARRSLPTAAGIPAVTVPTAPNGGQQVFADAADPAPDDGADVAAGASC